MRKTKEVVIDFRRKLPQPTPMNIWGPDMEIVERYRYLGVHLNNKLDWSQNADVLYEGLKSSPPAAETEVFRCVQASVKNFLRSFLVMASAIFHAVVC